MKLTIIYILIFFSFSSYTQNDTTIITSRPIFQQAVLEIESSQVLYAGQEYIFTITTSGHYDLIINVKNALVHLIENSKNSTGGFRYSVTPIDTGQCSFSIGNIAGGSQVHLKMHSYNVIHYPVPPINISGLRSGEILDILNDTMVIQCAYPNELGIYDNYEIKSWSAIVGNRTFSGNGNLISKELTQHVNQLENKFLHLKVILKKNKTGHLSSEGIYLIM